MKKQITYTSTLPDDLITLVNEYAEKYKVSKNKIIEKALRRFLFEAKRKEFQEGFKRVANDPEIVEVAEMGMGDYLELIQMYENDKL
jgi:metal-responsive CopG/Arc/MetJ family transcriptional regulator